MAMKHAMAPCDTDDRALNKDGEPSSTDAGHADAVEDCPWISLEGVQKSRKKNGLEDTTS
ncbi:MAG TPA: hypothetical protein VGO51_10950 [Burkholderiaceae bacterium]|jgi:hypothetical protein|nr:hypothetical protein [Burkholderiaceae bacterium]